MVQVYSMMSWSTFPLQLQSAGSITVNKHFFNAKKFKSNLCSGLFHFLSCEYVQLVFVLYHREFHIFGFWTGDQTTVSWLCLKRWIMYKENKHKLQPQTVLKDTSVTVDSLSVFKHKVNDVSQSVLYPGTVSFWTCMYPWLYRWTTRSFNWLWNSHNLKHKCKIKIRVVLE